MGRRGKFLLFVILGIVVQESRWRVRCLESVREARKPQGTHIIPMQSHSNTDWKEIVLGT